MTQHKKFKLCIKTIEEARFESSILKRKSANEDKNNGEASLVA